MAFHLGPTARVQRDLVVLPVRSPAVVEPSSKAPHGR